MTTEREYESQCVANEMATNIDWSEIQTDNAHFSIDYLGKCYTGWCEWRVIPTSMADTRAFIHPNGKMPSVAEDLVLEAFEQLEMEEAE